MKAIDLLLTFEGHRIFKGDNFLNPKSAMRDYWSVFEGKVEPVFYYQSFRKCQSLLGQPDVIMKSTKGNFMYLWKIEE